MKKRFLSILMALCLTLTLLPTAALADGTVREVSSEQEFRSAITDASSGDTVKLMADIWITPTGEGTRLTPQVSLNTEVTLDLNGYTLGVAESAHGQSLTYTPVLLSVETGAKLTITGNGTITSECGNNNSYCIDVNGGEVVVENGKFYGAVTAIQVESGNLIINGGTFDLAPTCKAQVPDYAKYVVNCIDKAFGDNTATISITGGTFVNFDPSDNPEGTGTSYVAESYTPAIDVDGNFEILSESDENIVIDKATGNKYVNQEAMEANEVDFVSKIGNEYYETLQAAIEDASTGETVTLLKDTQEDITIGEGKKITLDMGSHTLTNQSGDTISNHGTLTVIGSGTVDNITHGKGAIVNYVGAIANLNGGTFTRSLEQTSNSWYTVKNLGEMTIDGATVQTGENSTGSSSLIANGWYNSDSPTTGDRNEKHEDSTVAKLTIISGTFSGGMNTVKNDDYGVLNIEGGTFANTTGPLILNWNEATISGGTFTANTGAALANGYLNDSGDKGQFTITGGTFTSGNNGESGLFAYGDGSKNGGTLSIRGGVFVGQLSGSAPYEVSISAGSFSNLVPEEYCAEDFVPVTTKDDNGMYTVTGKEEDGETVTGLTLEPKNLTLTDGETYQLKAVTTPEGSSLTWTSSNTSVVKVNSSGRVTAVGTGTATITVKAGQLSLTCKVTVKAAPSSSGSSSSDPSYSPILDVSDGGSIKVNPRTPEEDDEVTITVDPDSGYEVDEVTVTDRNGREVKVTAERDGTYTFTQPRGRVTISVTFVREGGSTFFSDVPESFWAYDEIAWAYDNGYVNGTSASAFSPNASISRQQVWMILARLSGADPANMSAAREWAVTNGVSDGTTPGGAVTRQQLVALLYRYATLMGYANDQRADLSAYPDAGTVAGYAVEPMQWSVANSIVGGTSNGTLDPTGTATRAQFAVILYRFWDQVG